MKLSLHAAVVTGLGLVYRCAVLLLPTLRSWELRTKTHNLIDKPVASRLVSNMIRGEWFFLCLIGCNLDPYIFSRLCVQLDKTLAGRKGHSEGTSLENGGLPVPTQAAERIYPILSSPSEAEKAAEAAASAAAAVEMALDAAAEQIELNELNISKK